MKTYNGSPVPETFNPNFIISAFANEIDIGKIEEYAEVMKREMLSNEFPPIMGYPSVIDERNIGECFLSGEEITKEHIGKKCWKVTDGHHRTLAAINAKLPYICVKLDYSCITDEKELNQ